MKNSQKNAIKSENLPYPAVTFSMITYQYVYINWTHNLWKFGGGTINTSYMNDRQ